MAKTPRARGDTARRPASRDSERSATETVKEITGHVPLIVPCRIEREPTAIEATDNADERMVLGSAGDWLAGAFHDPRFAVHQDSCVKGVLDGQQKCSVGGGCLDFEVARERCADRDRDGERVQFHAFSVRAKAKCVSWLMRPQLESVVNECPGDWLGSNA